MKKISSSHQSQPAEDAIYGRFHLQDESSMRSVMSRIDPRRVYDLSVDYFVGMPGFLSAGDPPYQIWMTHTPGGTVVDDVRGHGRAANESIGYSGDAILMYTHTGTHIDALNHFGYGESIHGGYLASEHLGSRSWTVGGADRIPPIVARGILLDVAASEGVEVLPDSFSIGPEEIAAALEHGRVDIREGDVVLIRTGRMKLWTAGDVYSNKPPGLNRAGAEFLAERGAMVVGTDAVGIEQLPSVELPANPNPVHVYLLYDCGIVIIEVVDLEDLSADGVFEFGFLASSIKLRGATAAPLRPVALPLDSAGSID